MISGFVDARVRADYEGNWHVPWRLVVRMTDCRGDPIIDDRQVENRLTTERTRGRSPPIGTGVEPRSTGSVADPAWHGLACR